MKPRRRRLSLVGLLVVGLLPVVWFLTDWVVFTICLPFLSMSKIPTSANSPCESRHNEFCSFIVYGQQKQDKLKFCCFKTMKSTYDNKGQISKIRKITYRNFAADSLSLRKLGSMRVP